MMFLLLSLLLVSSAAGIDCPAGYSNENGHPYCYKLNYKSVTYEEATRECQTQGATLPTILDFTVSNDVVSMGRISSNIWLGVYCESGLEYDCYYQDGTSLNSTGYMNFATTPTPKKQCVRMTTSGVNTGKWYAISCGGEQLAYVCQYAKIRPQIGYCNAGVTLSAPITITSPGFPSNYPSDISCQYKVAGAAGRKLNISFQSFALDNLSAVTLFNDGVFNSNVQLWTGSQNAFQQTINGNVALLAFDSSEITARGFSATITVV